MYDNGWVRPDSVPYPMVYSYFKGKKPMPDGDIPNFWIEDAREDMEEEIIEHLLEYFLKDEVISKSLNYYNQEKEFFSKMYKTIVPMYLKKRLTVVAMTDWPNGRPQLAGFNLVNVSRRGDKFELPVEYGVIKKMVKVVISTMQMVDVFEKYGVEEFSTAMALSVKPEFRGQNLGVELLKARTQATRAMGMKLSVNVFTGGAAQKQAERAGYKLLVDRPYSEIKDDDGNEMFPGIEAKSLQFRAIFIDTDN